MTTARVTAVMLDGTKHDATGVFMALADRVAFERLFNVSVLQMRREAGAVDDTGSDVGGLREERAAFFTWRVLSRASCPVGSFEEFLDTVDSIGVERLEGSLDPTDAGLPPGT